MRESKLVSVIMCFFNGISWIEEAVDSVLNQTYSDWELVLVDDGSTDGATEIAKKYARLHSARVRYLDHEDHKNFGLTHSRNCGIRASSGEFIAFLDADDWWFPGKLSGDLRLFILYPAAGMVCQASTFWYSWAEPDRQDEYVAVGVEADRLYPPLSLTEKLYPLGAGAPPCPSGVTIRSSVLHAHGGFEEQFAGIFGLYEDQAFLAKIYLHENVFVSGRANNLYRKHAGSMTDRLKDETLYRTVRLFFLRWLGEYLTRHPSVPDRIRKIVSAARVSTGGEDDFIPG